MNHTEAIETMLKNLDDWRHLPKYQLERRADLFFGLFIRQIVAAHTQSEIHPLVIPEFPFRHNKNNSDTKHTVNFDYVLFSKTLHTMYIVELKTDSGSYRESQDSYLVRAESEGFNSLIDGLNQVVGATSTSKIRKYEYLCALLADAGIISIDSKMNVLKCPKMKILYLGPPPSDKELETDLRENRKLIDFHEAAVSLENSGGAVECHFASYLRRWNDIKAGDYND